MTPVRDLLQGMGRHQKTDPGKNTQVNPVKKGKVVLALLLALLVCSLTANVALLRMTLAYYAREQAVRLDPLSDRNFETRNSAVAPRSGSKSRIVFAGDSRVELWWPLPNITGAELINSGRSSDTAKQVLLRLERDVLAHKPDVVVLEAGINNLKTIGVFPERARAIQSECEAQLRAIADRLKARGVQVVLLPIFPVGSIAPARRLVWSNRSLDAIDAMNETLKNWADGQIHFVDCLSALSEHGRMKAAFTADDFHLTPAGYAALNAELEPILVELCKRKGPQG